MTGKAVVHCVGPTRPRLRPLGTSALPPKADKRMGVLLSLLCAKSGHSQCSSQRLYAMLLLGAIDQLSDVSRLDHATVVIVLLFDKGRGRITTCSNRKKALRIKFWNDLRIAQRI